MLMPGTAHTGQNARQWLRQSRRAELPFCDAVLDRSRRH